MDTTAQDPTLTPAQREAAGAFARGVFARFADALGMLFGIEVTIAPGEVAVDDPDGLRLRLPSHGACLVGRPETGVSGAIAVMGVPLARTFGHLGRMGAPEELEARRSQPPPLEDEDQEQLRTVAGLFAAALAETSGGSTDEEDAGGDQTGLILLVDSTWDSDEDPLGEGWWLRAEATCTAGGPRGEALSLLVPWELARELSPPLGAAPGQAGPQAARVDVEEAGPAGASGPRAASPPAAVDDRKLPPIVCIGDRALARHLTQAFDTRPVVTLPDVTSLGELLKESPPPALAVVRVHGRKDTHTLEELGRLKTARGRGLPVMVLLERPVRSTVLLCGRLGLVNVLPASVEPDMVVRRIRPSLPPL